MPFQNYWGGGGGREGASRATLVFYSVKLCSSVDMEVSIFHGQLPIESETIIRKNQPSQKPEITVFKSRSSSFITSKNVFSLNVFGMSIL